MTEARFWAKVDFTDTCWLWTAGRFTAGYGCFGGWGKTRSAHRVAYCLLIGPIPADMNIDHLCRVRHCVNPFHMELVTRAENVMRGNGIMARNARKTVCKRGHSLDGAYINKPPSLPRGVRRCRVCADNYRKFYRARRAGKAVTKQDYGLG